MGGHRNKEEIMVPHELGSSQNRRPVRPSLFQESPVLGPALQLNWAAIHMDHLKRAKVGGKDHNLHIPVKEGSTLPKRSLNFGD